MPPETTRAHFEAHGWAVIRAAVHHGRADALARAADALYAASPPANAGPWELPGASRASAEIAQWVHDPDLAHHAATMLGCRRVQLLQDTLLVKPPGGGHLAWHQDHTYTGYLQPARLVSLRLALDAGDAGPGCMEVIDASHRLGLRGEVRALADAGVADALGANAEQFADRRVRIELAPGDLSIHHCLLLHSSGINPRATPRRTLITRVFDAACTLMAERLPPWAAAYFPAGPDGRLSEEAFPLLHTR